MRKTTVLFGLSTLVLAGVVLTPAVAEAYRGDPSTKGPNHTQERHEAMEKAFEAKDYNAWKALMVGRGRVTQVVNASNFSQFAQAHELAEQGKTAEAEKIRAELGLGLHNGSGRGQRMGAGRTNR